MERFERKPLARSTAEMDAFDPSEIQFGTDGWRAIIGAGFTAENLARVVAAAARVFTEADLPASFGGKPVDLTEAKPTLLIGYDCRENASRYAALAGVILASFGFRVQISDNYCPTPALCWSVAQNPDAIGGLILTSSHNPAEYLGVKLRMSDGGASPKSFSDRVEAALSAQLPEAFPAALAFADNTNPDIPPGLEYTDFMTPYLADLASLVDAEAIAARRLKVLVDPMFGAGRAYLATLLRSLGVEVVEINATEDPSFAGLHPEPILPWIQDALTQTAQLGFDACFITDGDADRIGAGTRDGAFVDPHKILALVCALLVSDKHQKGRVVRTLSGSNLIKRQCERLGLDLVTTPIGFKWIYEEMLAGDVMLGGEESGGIGIPSHVRERDGLLMALLLTELMAKQGKDLSELVDDLLSSLGQLLYARQDLRLTEAQKADFLREICARMLPAEAYQSVFAAISESIINIDYRDGIKFEFASDAWLLARPSGTEPLVRVYAEAAISEQVELLLGIGCGLATGELRIKN